MDTRGQRVVCLTESPGSRWPREPGYVTADIKQLYQDIVASIALRTLHEVFEADQADALSICTFNGMIDTHDPASGRPIRVPVVSVRAPKAAFLELRLDRVEKVACLCSLGAQVPSRPDELQAIKPIIEFNMVDKRFIEQQDVLGSLESRPNCSNSPQPVSRRSSRTCSPRWGLTLS